MQKKYVKLQKLSEELLCAGDSWSAATEACCQEVHCRIANIPSLYRILESVDPNPRPNILDL